MQTPESASSAEVPSRPSVERARKDSTASRIRASLSRKSRSKIAAEGESMDVASLSNETRQPPITPIKAEDGTLQGPDINKLAPVNANGAASPSSASTQHRRIGSLGFHRRNASAASENVGSTTAHDHARRQTASPQPPPPPAPAVPSKSPLNDLAKRSSAHQPPIVENPLRKEESRIFWFYLASTLSIILITRYLHWFAALLLAATLGYVQRTQLSIAADDSEWTKAEVARLMQQEADEEKSESVEWMNAVLKTVWPLINQDYFAPFVDLMEDALMLQVPGIVHSCRVEDLDQGTVPLRVQSFTLLDSHEDAFIEGIAPDKVHDAQCETPEELLDGAGNTDNHPFDVGEFVNLEITFAYRSPAARRKMFKSNKADGVMSEEDRQISANVATYDSTLPIDQIHMLIYMSIGLQKIAAVEVPVWCEVLGIEGKMRLRLQMVPTAPFVAHVAFTFVGQPKLEISAKPLGRRMVIDAMHLPIISSYVLHSVEAVVKNFISPKSYTVDIASLLEANDGPRNVYALGVIVLVIHQGTELPAADANGKSDPFVSVSFARAGKPLFTTRVLLRTRDPIWQEVAVLPVSPDEIRDHERLRMTVFDADRFSVDDPLGKVEVSIDKLIHRALQHRNEASAASLLETQTEPLHPMRRNGKVQGRMSYSVGFFPLSKPTQGGRTATKVQLLRQAAERHQEEGALSADALEESGDKSLPELPDTPKSPEAHESAKGNLFPAYATGFDRFVHSLGFPLDDEVLRRRKERSERVKKLTTMMEGEAQATFGPPDKAWRSGILAFHIHSIEGLGFEPPQRSRTNSKRLAAKPQYSADEDPLGEGTSKMPNSYVQVLLNDEAIFRSRTKTFNPQPFINAGSERWVPDFETARIDFVVRDARQRENDPILGVVGVKLSDKIVSTCRVTQVYTLTGGLGFGKIRITLLWRSCEVSIPAPLRGWNVGVMEVASCYIGGVSAAHKSMFEKKEAHMLFETVGGRAETDNLEPHDEYESGEGSAATIGFQWPLKTPVRIAIRQRYPNFLYIHLRSDSRVPGRTHKHAHGVIPLNSMIDNTETRRRVPLYEASDWQRFEQDILRGVCSPEQLVAGSSHRRKRLPVLQDIATSTQDSQAIKVGQQRRESREGGADNENGDMKDESGEPPLTHFGYLDITFIYHAGLAPEHASRMAGDHELRVAVECYQALVDSGQRPRSKMLSPARKRKLSIKGQRGDAVGADMEMVEVPDATPSTAASAMSHTLRVDTGAAHATQSGSGKGGVDNSDEDPHEAYDVEYDEDELEHDGEEGEDDNDDDDEDHDSNLVDAETAEGRRARVRTLHRQQRGAAQVKSYRTLQWLKTNAEDGVGRVKRIASRQQGKRIAKMENEGVSHF